MEIPRLLLFGGFLLIRWHLLFFPKRNKNGGYVVSMLMAMPKLGREGKKRKLENVEQFGMTSQICMEVCTSRGWTRDEEFALQRDYLTAKQSPHLWKKVLKMVLCV